MQDINVVMSWLDGLTEDDWAPYHSDSEVQNIAKAALELLENMEEVVRCKDCKWGETYKNAYGEDRIICGNDDTYIDRYITVPADWYCADGERLENLE